MRYTKKIDKAVKAKASRYLNKPDYYFGLMKLFVINEDKRNKTGLVVREVGTTFCTAGLRPNEGNVTSRTKFVISVINFAHLHRLNSNCNHLDDDDYKQSKKLYTWLFNHSPYKHCFVTKSAEKAFKQGYIVLDANQDARMVAEAAMTTRSIWEESRDHIKYVFDKLTKFGVSPAMAWQASYHFMYLNKDIIKTNRAWGHTAPQGNMDTLESLKQFVIEGKMLPITVNELRRDSSCDLAKGTKLHSAGGIPSGVIAKGWGSFAKPEVVHDKLNCFVEEISDIKTSTGLLGGAVFNAFKNVGVLSSGKCCKNTNKNWSLIANFFKDLERDLERL